MKIVKKITIISKDGNPKEIEVDENLLGVMNHRDFTVDYRQGRQIIRFQMTDDAFEDLITYFKKPPVEKIVEEVTEDVIEIGKDPLEE